eukprot:CAMPEP_0172525432 /NCGR_PEP_ID=MMETSP1067-20121228/455_1 /TAXON_ID=265564 ORGANISM="Thalassiosira punctigera, Strain Tpunct2005C2" /NCGR_SAMPLE_ID=MMETSP1067 /ASSEMBLY_ACC=CAM_ASM_000444 /LENGTH=93 /DNA_ID=CAMNT_0013308683 /DNA_START=301 /DNA_END=579 /DNA_ORIENTATION=-
MALTTTPTTEAFAPRHCPSRAIPHQTCKQNSLLQMNYIQKESLAAASSSNESKELGPQPVVVSAEAEALSHSKTTLKLTPSFDLFQMLPKDEG